MKKLKQALSRVLAALGRTKDQHALAARRWRRKHNRAHKLHGRARQTEHEADAARAASKEKRAEQLDAQAQALHADADAAHRGARVQIAKARALKKKMKGQAQHVLELRDQLAKELKSHGLHVEGNLIKGDGPAGAKVMAAWHAAGARCASGDRRNVYSMGGAFVADRFIIGEPVGYRSDCSQAYISSFHSAGLPSPSGSWTAGFTGSIADHGGPRISRETARHTKAAAVEWGSYPFHHIEAAEGDGSENTMGHGSPPIDRGDFDLLGPADAFYDVVGHLTH